MEVSMPECSIDFHPMEILRGFRYVEHGVDSTGQLFIVESREDLLGSMTLIRLRYMSERCSISSGGYPPEH
jgi:hypothetical protein